ncbi:MAG: hypothetical protein ACM3ZA_00210 [Bacillota bacterium]
MQAPETIRRVYGWFRGIPMETFTKGWWYAQCDGAPRQRTVDEMREHRQRQGPGGNCFDLVLWLREEYREAGISARVIGHDLETARARVALLVRDASGLEYLCDPGDLWLEPILVTPDAPGFSAEWQSGFFPGRRVQVARASDRLEVAYLRASGRVGRQSYDLAPVSEEQLHRACQHSQSLLRRPFCEMLLPHPDTARVEHWEYDEGTSFWNLDD